MIKSDFIYCKIQIDSQVKVKKINSLITSTLSGFKVQLENRLTWDRESFWIEWVQVRLDFI